ncbi:MAG: NADH-quinone oxidoreductase subunit M [Rickettsiaceae bacterium]|nr:NADH-quinone oxidoreductase subunit M [Rickettsiaceae bacterium]
MELNSSILSITMFLPMLGALYIAFIIGSNKTENKEQQAHYVAIFTASVTLIAASVMLFKFDINERGFQFIEKYQWINAIGLEYFIGLDGLSIYFVLLTTLLSLICIIASSFTINFKRKEFLICFLLLESFCIGAFSALNLLLFYIFFEIVLIPMYLIIGIWGGENKLYAAVKFFLYTFFGSVFLLLALIYIYVKTGTFGLPELFKQLPLLSLYKQQLLGAAILFSMAIKVPMIPFHTWLPDAHVQAPTTGSVILAGILLKLGGYGILRLLIPMFPKAMLLFAPYIVLISVAAVIYASFLALCQTDMKKMIAYSSVAHMGYVTGGIFSFSVESISGAIFQMISHGVISSALFLIVGILYERAHTKEIAKYGGLAHNMPILAFCFMIATLGSIGLPGLSGFIGEFLSIIGIFSYNYKAGIICAFGVVLGAVYMLKLYRDVMFGPVNPNTINFKDLKFTEVISLTPLILLIFVLGLVPNIVLTVIDSYLLNLANIYKF